MTVKEEARKVTFWDRLENVPRWVIFIFVIIAMAAPILRPFGLPITVGSIAKDAFDAVEATPDGSWVVFHVDYGAGGRPTLQPGSVAISHHLFQKNVKIIYFCGGMVDLANIYGIFDKIKPEETYGKKYGDDYVVLLLAGPFMTQADIVLSNLLEVIPEDAEDNRLTDLPIFDGYVETESIGLVVQLTTSGDVSEGWVMQAYSMYERRLVGGWLSMMTSSMIPYYDAGQMLGFIDGSKGAADYEVLVKQPGEAIKIMDVLSLTQVVYLVFIVIGNIAFFGKKYLVGGE